MSKVSYANLKLKVNSDINTFEFKGQTIEVLKYLPVDDKYDLIMITLQKSFEDGFYNEVKLDTYFHLYLVYMYTNLSFTDKQKEDEFKLYDTLKSNGFIDQMLDTIDEDEYRTLYEYLEKVKWETDKNRLSVSAFIQKIINDLPKNAEAAAQIVENFNPEKYQQVIQFAEAANGGRPIRGPLKNRVVPVTDKND